MAGPRMSRRPQRRWAPGQLINQCALSFEALLGQGLLCAQRNHRGSLQPLRHTGTERERAELADWTTCLRYPVILFIPVTINYSWQGNQADRERDEGGGDIGWAMFTRPEEQSPTLMETSRSSLVILTWWGIPQKATLTLGPTAPQPSQLHINQRQIEA